VKYAMLVIVVAMFLGGCATQEVFRAGPFVFSAGANATEVSAEAKAETSQLITWACGAIPFVPGC